MKYSLFRKIDSVNDESVLSKLTALVQGMLLVPDRNIPSAVTIQKRYPNL